MGFGRRAAAVVKDKKPRVGEARGLERTGNLVRFYASRKNILEKVFDSFAGSAGCRWGELLDYEEYRSY
jgi:hypothetical protein